MEYITRLAEENNIDLHASKTGVLKSLGPLIIFLIIIIVVIIIAFVLVSNYG
jgi:hypothetical protein